MEKQHIELEGVTDAVLSDVVAPRWVAPLESMTVYSINEFTQTALSPGDDSSGIFTQS
ncbi:hypothetical protein K9B35_12825 [Sphingomonas sp. R647]|uniref:hypothetical protein n=1 Tax=Sphingomonas sp. R647 TaxID=2875233 RepID=UPI001CD500BF|nr:hypothetical protein [Sphingomonas sp. R647]MCA1198853.1 hypothetical protein [Sphingomonas sp. R647]